MAVILKAISYDSVARKDIKALVNEAKVSCKLDIVWRR